MSKPVSLNSSTKQLESLQKSRNNKRRKRGGVQIWDEGFDLQDDDNKEINKSHIGHPSNSSYPSKCYAGLTIIHGIFCYIYHIQFELGNINGYSIEYCQFHRTLLWTWITLHRFFNHLKYKVGAPLASELERTCGAMLDWYRYIYIYIYTTFNYIWRGVNTT